MTSEANMPFYKPPPTEHEHVTAMAITGAHTNKDLHFLEYRVITLPLIHCY